MLWVGVKKGRLGVEASLVSLGGGFSGGLCFLMLICRILRRMFGFGVRMWGMVIPFMVCIKCLRGRRCTTMMHFQRLFGIKVFLWMHTKDNLVRRDVIPIDSQLCVSRCGQNESANHLIIHCPIFGSLWKHVKTWLVVYFVDPKYITDLFFVNLFILQEGTLHAVPFYIWFGFAVFEISGMSLPHIWYTVHYVYEKVIPFTNTAKSVTQFLWKGLNYFSSVVES